MFHNLCILPSTDVKNKNFLLSFWEGEWVCRHDYHPSSEVDRGVMIGVKTLCIIMSVIMNTDFRIVYPSFIGYCNVKFGGTYIPP